MNEKTIIRRDGAKIDNFTVTWDGNEYKFSIQEPNFEQLSHALTESVGLTGKLNMSGGGKVIFELCCFEHDPEITENARLLLSVCIDLYNEYVMPADTDIKKN